MLLPSLAAGPAAAPAHVHEADADHEHAVAHQHLAPHGLSAHQHNADEWDETTDAGVVWLDQAVLSEATFDLSPFVADVSQIDRAPVVTAESSMLSAEEVPPAHGPPRECLAHRGPPLLPV